MLSVDFIPDNSGRWMLESSIIDITTLNYDNDSLDEIMVLSSSWDTGNGDLLPRLVGLITIQIMMELQIFSSNL